MSKGGAIFHGVVGIGAVLVMGLRSCDDVFKAARHIDDIPIGAASRSYDDVYKVSKDSVASLDDISKGNSNIHSKSVTADDDIMMLMAKNSNSLGPENTLKGEHIHYSNIDEVSHIDLDGSWFEAVESPKIISLFPSNSMQYKNVYGKSPSISAESKIHKFQKKISTDPFLIAKDADQADVVFKTIADSDGGPIVILAHSEDGGRRVVFPDGSSMDITDVHAQCIEALKRCLVLTCHGDDFGIMENITATEALSIWGAVSKKSLAKQKVSVNDLVKEARIVRKKQKAKKSILISWSAATIVGTPFLKVSLQDEEVDNSNTNTASNKTL